MTNATRSSPISTGGAGFTFEHRVGALYLAALLLGEVPIGLPGEKIKTLSFQAPDFAPNGLDDIVIVFQDDNRAFLQLKRTISFTAKDTDFNEVISNFYRALSGERTVFNPATDSFLLGIGVHETREERHLRELLKWASNNEDTSRLLDKISNLGTKSPKRKYFNILTVLLRKQRPSLKDDEIISILRKFNIQYFDVEFEESSHRIACINSFIRKFRLSDELASGLFARLCEIAAELDSSSGTISYRSLQERVEPFNLQFEEEANTNLLELNDYKLRPEIKSVLKTIFNGRTAELQQIGKFVEDPDSKILVVLGDGGVGKTRLVLEFAQEYEKKNDSDSRHIYFFQPQSKMDSVHVRSNSILILDEASYFADLPRVLELVINAPKIKLIMLDRSIFKQSITAQISKKNIEAQCLDLQKGDIRTFLEDNFPSLDNEARPKINQECRNSFDYAMILAEFYQRKDESVELNTVEDIMNWKVAKYTQDIEERTGYKLPDIILAIDILSLLSLLNWENMKDKFKVLNDRQIGVLQNILLESRYEKRDLILHLGDSNYAIKPDVLADFIRIRALKEDNIRSLINLLVVDVPFTIAHNIANLLQYSAIGPIAREVLEKIWIALNQVPSGSQEYFSAIRFFINSKYDTGIEFDLHMSDVDCWNNSFDKIHAEFPEDNTVEDFGSLMVNAIPRLNEVHGYKRSLKILEILKERCAAHKPLESAYANSLQNMTHDFGEGHLDDKKYFIETLRNIFLRSQSDWDRTSLMGALANTIYDLREDFDLALDYLDEVRTLYRDEDKTSVQRLAVTIAIHNASVVFSDSNREEDLERNLVDREWHIIPYHEVRQTISDILYTRIVYNGQIENSKIFLLYTLRYHLPDEQKQNIVKLKAIEYLTSKVRTLCNHGSESLQLFLDETRPLIETYEIVLLTHFVLPMLYDDGKRLWIDTIAEWSE